MISFLRRYRWLLLNACLITGLAAWLLWPGMRIKYARIRIGMTRDEVRQIMGPDQFSSNLQLAEYVRGMFFWEWSTVAFDSDLYGQSDWMFVADGAFWTDSSIAICVEFRDGKAVAKSMKARKSFLEKKCKGVGSLLRPVKVIPPSPPRPSRVNTDRLINVW